jgi:hypothetical protein
MTRLQAETAAELSSQFSAILDWIYSGELCPKCKWVPGPSVR